MRVEGVEVEARVILWTVVKGCINLWGAIL